MTSLVKFDPSIPENKFERREINFKAPAIFVLIALILPHFNIINSTDHCCEPFLRVNRVGEGDNGYEKKKADLT